MVKGKCFCSPSLVNIKWGKEMLKDIEIDMDSDVLTFKTQVYALSDVPVDKQKIMIKGKIIKVSIPHKSCRMTKN